MTDETCRHRHGREEGGVSETVKRGDQFVQHPPPESGARWPLFIEVTRVARDGSWCDIRCCTWATTWTKRMPEGLGRLLDPANEFHITRESWTMADVQASEPSFVGGGI